MYILVEIIHTEFQYISLIEMQKYNWNRKRIEKRKTWKKRDLLSWLVTPTGTKGCASHVGAGCTFCPGWCYQPGQKVVARPGTKGHPLLSRTGVPGWETGTTAVSQPGQINVFVVVHPIPSQTQAFSIVACICILQLAAEALAKWKTELRVRLNSMLFSSLLV